VFILSFLFFFFFSSRRRHTRSKRDWSSDVCSSDLTWWYQRQFIPPAAHEPVSVVIADLQNNTGDPAFDRVLEPTIKRALEGASFISAYDRAGVTSTLGVRPPEILDEVAARQLAVREGLNVILSGSL